MVVTSLEGLHYHTEELLSVEQGGICAVAGDECYFYFNESELAEQNIQMRNSGEISEPALPFCTSTHGTRTFWWLDLFPP